MISSETSIYNLALNAIGARNNVTSPTENSREAEVCSLWYSAVRDQILEAAAWPESTKFAHLALISTQDDDTWTSGEATPGKQFAYAKPVDMLRPQYLNGFGQFQMTNGPNGQVYINTNSEQAMMFYTFRNELVAQWSASLQMAVVYGLAGHISMPLTGKTQRTNLMFNQANQLIMQARENAANVNTAPVLESIPDWISGRGYTAVSQTHYVYPFGNLLVAP